MCMNLTLLTTLLSLQSDQIGNQLNLTCSTNGKTKMYTLTDLTSSKVQGLCSELCSWHKTQWVHNLLHTWQYVIFYQFPWEGEEEGKNKEWTLKQIVLVMYLLLFVILYFSVIKEVSVNQSFGLYNVIARPSVSRASSLKP